MDTTPSRGQTVHHGGDVFGIVVFSDGDDSPTGREFFILIGTLIAVKLLTWRNCRSQPNLH
jgi:hypothetical protein